VVIPAAFPWSPPKHSPAANPGHRGRADVLQANPFGRLVRPENALLTCSGPAVNRLPGLTHFYAGVSPDGSMLQVSVWDSEEHSAKLNHAR
jgi:hypothetical protein